MHYTISEDMTYFDDYGTDELDRFVVPAAGGVVDGATRMKSAPEDGPLEFIATTALEEPVVLVLQGLQVCHANTMKYPWSETKVSISLSFLLLYSHKTEAGLKFILIGSDVRS